MRDRLIELIRTGVNKHEVTIENYVVPTSDFLADYLLANGVIVPPCKVGDKVYHVCSVFNDATLKSEKAIKTRVIDFVSSPAFIIESKGLILVERDFGKTVFLTKEEAEQALKGGAE